MPGGWLSELVASYRALPSKLQVQSAILYLIVARDSDFVDAAVAIYGASDRALELLQLNDVIDAFDIPANVTLSYYDSAA